MFPAAAPTMRAPRPSAMVVPDMDESPFFFASVDGPSGIRYKRRVRKRKRTPSVSLLASPSEDDIEDSKIRYLLGFLLERRFLTHQQSVVVWSGSEWPPLPPPPQDLQLQASFAVGIMDMGSWAWAIMIVETPSLLFLLSRTARSPSRWCLVAFTR